MGTVDYYAVVLGVAFCLGYKLSNRAGVKWRQLFIASTVAVIAFLCSHILPLHERALGAAKTSETLDRKYNSQSLTFDGDSSTLHRTQIVATLDATIEPMKNVIWCGSFQAAWKAVQNDLAHEPVQLSGSQALCAALNASPEVEVPEGELYAVAGWEDQDIIKQIQRDKQKLFPGSAPATFPGVAPGSIIAYGYLQSTCKFTIPYFDNCSSLEFTDSAGNKSLVRTFGLREEDSDAFNRLRYQAELLFVDHEASGQVRDFALDLCRDSPSTQFVLARVPPASSLQEVLDNIEKRLQEYQKLREQQGITTPRPGLGRTDILLVPNIAYQVVHQFAELQGLSFENKTLVPHGIGVAQQSIKFCLDRSGVELISEAKAYTAGRMLREDFVADRPFLLYLKKRSANMPYFVMWVDNAELLTKWPEKK